MPLILSLTSWLEKHQLPCLYKRFLGIECPGCGMQSAIIALLQGKIQESIAMYPPLLPLIVLCIFGILYAVFRFRKGDIILIIIAIFTGIIMTGNYFYRLILHF